MAIKSQNMPKVRRKRKRAKSANMPIKIINKYNLTIQNKHKIT
jgi:hypothetical protein